MCYSLSFMSRNINLGGCVSFLFNSDTLLFYVKGIDIGIYIGNTGGIFIWYRNKTRFFEYPTLLLRDVVEFWTWHYIIYLCRLMLLTKVHLFWVPDFCKYHFLIIDYLFWFHYLTISLCSSRATEERTPQWTVAQWVQLLFLSFLNKELCWLWWWNLCNLSLMWFVLLYRVLMVITAKTELLVLLDFQVQM